MSGLSFEAEVASFLAVCRTASLATVSVTAPATASGGVPHAANVQYATGLVGRPFDLIWLSSPQSEHSLDLAAEPIAAATVYGHLDDPENIHGVQMRGRVVSCGIGSTRAQNAWDCYTAKYPFVTEPPFADIVQSKQRLYVLSPTWLRWIDNRKGFGWKREVSFDAE